MIKPLKILMLEDMEEDVGLIKRVLTKQDLQFQSMRVDTRLEFESALDSFSPDVILSDHALPQFNSLEALTLCNNRKMNVPFILVTGTVSEEFAVSCLKKGADDYVLKSNLVRLPTAIVNALRQREYEEKRRNSEMQLRVQNEQLIKINSELDSFVYSVSHNLRAPLMSVLGLLNIVQIENGGGEGSINQYLQMMSHSIHKLDETLKEILDYSRNARSEVKIELVDLERLLEDSFERMMYINGADQIKKSVEINAQVPFYSDSYRLSVIVNNLLSNAIKYHDDQKSESRIDIIISVNADVAQIIFRDNGIGISSELVPKIFDMFYRATERSEGAGLGLYIVKETIDRLQGKIEVASQLDVSTTFKIEIPNAIRTAS